MIPQTKNDSKAIEELKKASKEEIILNSDLLIVWIQDSNWSVASPVADELRKYTNEISQSIIKVLRCKDDPDWKYNVIIQLLYYSKERINNALIKELERLVENSENEMPQIIDECKDVLKKWK